MRHAKTLLTAAVLTGGAAVPASADIVSFGFSIGLSDACAPTYYDTSYDCGVYTYSYSGYGWPGYGYSGYRPWWSAYRPAWYSTWCAPAYVYRPVCPPPVIVVPRPVYYYGYSPSWCWPSYGSWCDDGVTWGFGYSSWSGWSISFGWSSGWSSWHRPRPWHCGDGYWRDGRDWDHRPGRGGWDGRAGASAPLVGPTSDLAKPLASNMPAAGALGVAGVGSTDKPRLLPAVGSIADGGRGGGVTDGRGGGRVDAGDKPVRGGGGKPGGRGDVASGGGGRGDGMIEGKPVTLPAPAKPGVPGPVAGKPPVENAPIGAKPGASGPVAGKPGEIAGGGGGGGKPSVRLPVEARPRDSVASRPERVPPGVRPRDVNQPGNGAPSAGKPGGGGGGRPMQDAAPPAVKPSVPAPAPSPAPVTNKPQQPQTKPQAQPPAMAPGGKPGGGGGGGGMNGGGGGGRQTMPAPAPRMEQRPAMPAPAPAPSVKPSAPAPMPVPSTARPGGGGGGGGRQTMPAPAPRMDQRPAMRAPAPAPSVKPSAPMPMPAPAPAPSMSKPSAPPPPSGGGGGGGGGGRGGPGGGGGGGGRDRDRK